MLYVWAYKRRRGADGVSIAVGCTSTDEGIPTCTHTTGPSLPGGLCRMVSRRLGAAHVVRELYQDVEYEGTYRGYGMARPFVPY